MIAKNAWLAGAAVSKPIDEEILLKTVHDCLRNGGVPAPAEASGPIPAIASDAIHCSQTNNPRVMEIVPEFVAALPTKVRKMIDLLERSDLSGLQRIAHQLSGTCSGYGFGPVTQPARTVEQSIKEGKAVESVAAEVKTLIELIRRVDGYDGSKELDPTVKAPH
jgi:HPt (histidine-containing phosphotransfer) domain-containing protein